MRLQALLEAIKGRVTDKAYPFREEPAPPSFRGPPIPDPSKCIGCGACMRACPAHAIMLKYDASDRVYILEHNIMRCIFCEYCVDVCPMNALSVSREYELATTDPSKLYQRVVHRPASCLECGSDYATHASILEALSRVKVRIRPEYIFRCSSCRARFAARIIASARKGGRYEL